MIMSVEGYTEAIFTHYSEYGKSPCFPRSCILTVASLGQRGIVLAISNMGNYSECI